MTWTNGRRLATISATLTGGAALLVGVAATVGLSTLFDYVYDEHYKESVDGYLPYGIYG